MEKGCKEVMIKFKLLPGICLKKLRIASKHLLHNNLKNFNLNKIITFNDIRIHSIQAEIWIREFSNIKQDG
jgi:hypothetical protein